MIDMKTKIKVRRKLLKESKFQFQFRKCLDRNDDFLYTREFA